MKYSEVVFSSCKKVKSLDICFPWRLIYKDFHYANPSTDSLSDSKTFFGYQADQEHSQFLGYLLLDEYREVAESNLGFPIKNLEESEKLIIRKLHCFIHYFNSRAFKMIENTFGFNLATIDPYCEKNKINFDFTTLYENHIYEIIDPILEALKTTKVFEKLRTLQSEFFFDKSVNTDTINELVNNIYKDIIKTNYYTVNKELESFLVSFRGKKTENHKVYELIFTLICLRDILCNTNQIIFQAFNYDKFKVIDENVIVGIDNFTQSAISSGITVQGQPSENYHTPSYNEIVLIRIDSLSYKEVSKTNGYSFNLNLTTGMSFECEFRKLDEDFNSLPGILIN